MALQSTHYIPALTKHAGATQQAVCGAYITASVHSSEPTCALCRVWFASLDTPRAESRS
jgi:hypothetical protein